MRLYVFILVLLTFPASLHALESETGSITLRNGKKTRRIEDDFIPEKIRLRFTQDYSFIQPDLYQTTHVGLWHYICKHIDRSFSDYLTADRHAYVAMSLHPYYAEKRYDHMIGQFSRRKIYTAKAASPYLSVGRISLGRDMRLRLDGLPKYGRRLVSMVGTSRSYKTRFRLRARLNVKLRSSSFGIKTVGVKMTGLFADRQGKNLPINIFMTAKHKISDRESIFFIGISI